jgi:hypothetical protein
MTHREIDGEIDDNTLDPSARDQGELRERQTVARRGRRRSASSLSIISWRDIPAQLSARAGEESSKLLLHARFQHAIDRAAAVAGLTSTDDYVQQWRTSSQPIGDGDVAAQLDRWCAEIEHEYPRDRLEALVANGGLEPSSGDGRAVTTSEPNSDPNPGPNVDPNSDPNSGSSTPNGAGDASITAPVSESDTP